MVYSNQWLEKASDQNENVFIYIASFIYVFIAELKYMCNSK